MGNFAKLIGDGAGSILRRSHLLSRTSNEVKFSPGPSLIEHPGKLYAMERVYAGSEGDKKEHLGRHPMQGTRKGGPLRSNKGMGGKGGLARGSRRIQGSEWGVRGSSSSHGPQITRGASLRGASSEKGMRRRTQPMRARRELDERRRLQQASSLKEERRQTL